MSAFLRLPVTHRKRQRSFGCSHWKKKRFSKRRSCVISCSSVLFLTFPVIGSVLLAFPLSAIWYILCPVPACLVWWSPLIAWLQLGQLSASSRLNLCLTESMRSGCFLFLLEASLKGRFSLCLTCTRPFAAHRTSPDRTSPSVCSLAKCCLLKRANQGNKIDPVFNKCSIESCGEFKRWKTSEGLSSLNYYWLT